MEPSSIVKLATEVGKVISSVVERLPTHEQKVMKNFYDFLDLYSIETKRKDADTDDLIIWRQRKRLLIDTIIKQLIEKKVE